MLKALIIEQLEADGTLRSFEMQPSTRDGKIVVAFADEYQEDRKGPFHFLNESDEERFATGFASCRARILGSGRFRLDDKGFHVELNWSGIPTQAQWLSYYALSLPPHAIPLQISIKDPHNPRREYRRNVTRDDERERYVIYLECTSKLGRFDFELSCSFQIDPLRFLSSSYADAKTNESYGRAADDWKYLLPEGEQKKVQQFLIGTVHVGDNYSAGQSGAMGPHAHAHDIGLNQANLHHLDDIDMRKLAGELSSLVCAMQQRITNQGQITAIAQVAAAEMAAQKHDASSVLRHLKSAGKWAFDVATKVGVNVAAEVIKKANGL